MSQMSYTARNASRYKLSEYNWLAWSRSYGCAPDVNARCRVQADGGTVRLLRRSAARCAGDGH